MGTKTGGDMTDAVVAFNTGREVSALAPSYHWKNIGCVPAIVLERDADLSDYLEEGTPVDARVTQELIFSILVPSSPIHDGAIIIQKGRLAAAGCFLPLTMNPRVSRFLGTRHRAAIGVTEETDAVVIVVSEETGHISLAVSGELRSDLDPVALRNELLHLFGRSARPKNRIRPSAKRADDAA